MWNIMWRIKNWYKSKIGCDNGKRSGTDRSSDGIFANHTTIRSRDISNVQEFLAILYWIRVAHFIRICLISYPCRVWKLRTGMFEWTVNENDSTVCCVKLGKKLPPTIELTEDGVRDERLNARGRKREIPQSFTGQSAAKIFWYSTTTVG